MYFEINALKFPAEFPLKFTLYLSIEHNLLW